MSSAKHVSMKAKKLAGTDDLSGYTPLHRNNYLLNSHLIETLPQGAFVLQGGSMDGALVIGLLRNRPDLSFTRLDVEPALTDIACANRVLFHDRLEHALRGKGATMFRNSVRSR